MNSQTVLDKVREKISAVDDQMAKLFEERMRLSTEVADIKQKNNIPIVDFKREETVKEEFSALVSPEYQNQAKMFAATLMTFSKMKQRERIFSQEAEILFPSPVSLTDSSAVVAYQGVAGAWGEAACLKLFSDCERISCELFEDVFEAVSRGAVTYGVLPIENSETGAIGEVYDLLKKYGCYLVGQTWIPIEHCLMVKKGTVLRDIKEVYSHPEGLKQCSKFLRNYPWHQTATTNTAVAAKAVAAKRTLHSAAIASPNAAGLYGLEILETQIVNNRSNKTRFIVIAKQPQYDESCDNITISFKTAHQSGALCNVLFQLMAGDINISRIESRPAAGGEYRFFADLKGNIAEQRVIDSLRLAKGACTYLEVLGCYKETM